MTKVAGVPGREGSGPSENQARSQTTRSRVWLKMTAKELLAGLSQCLLKIKLKGSILSPVCLEASDGDSPLLPLHASRSTQPGRECSATETFDARHNKHFVPPNPMC